MPRIGSIETAVCLTAITERLAELAPMGTNPPDPRDRESAHFDADRLLVQAIGTLAEAGIYAEELTRLVAAWESVQKAYC